MFDPSLARFTLDIERQARQQRDEHVRRDPEYGWMVGHFLPEIGDVTVMPSLWRRLLARVARARGAMFQPRPVLSEGIAEADTAAVPVATVPQ